jgi:hypothetical protein
VGPLAISTIAECVLAMKRLLLGDQKLFRNLMESLRIALRRMELKDVARRVITGPDVWWKLAKA